MGLAPYAPGKRAGGSTESRLVFSGTTNWSDLETVLQIESIIKISSNSMGNMVYKPGATTGIKND